YILNRISYTLHRTSYQAPHYTSIDNSLSAGSIKLKAFSFRQMKLSIGLSEQMAVDRVEG
ncbi:MAG: hypothetical protein QM594_06470, partial [Niabella sp.]